MPVENYCNACNEWDVFIVGNKLPTAFLKDI